MTGFGLNSGFTIFGILFAIVFVAILGVIVYSLVKSAQQRSKDNKSPRLTVDATVVAKRMDVSHYRHANVGDATGAHGYHSSSSTTYFATFQVASGDRMELKVASNQYGFLVEGDRGKLSFQGSRFLGFERQ